jgi:hypothetical protein
LIREIIDIEPGKQGYTIHVNLPTDRALILRKLLRQETMGMRQWASVYIDYYPLGPLEEAELYRYLQSEREKKGLFGPPRPLEISEERGRVIQQVLQYLMLDHEAELQMILIEQPGLNTGQLENLRRSGITETRRHSHIPQQRGRPFLNENTIEKYVEGHKNYIYKKYLQNPDRKEIYQRFMSKKNVENRNKKLRTSTRRYRSQYNNYNSNYGNNQAGPFNFVRIPRELGINKNYPKMTSVNFERYVRSLRGKAEKNLPYQGNFHLENLFGTNE